MGLRYLGNIIKPGYNPLASNITSGVSTAQYQGIFTLNQQDQALPQQQWVTDPNFKNTTLLLQADNAANGAQNNTFLDSSTNAFAITRNGNTTQGTFTPFSNQPGAWSVYCSGSAYNPLFVNAGTACAFGTGDFTIEFFFFCAGATTDNQILFDQRPTATNGFYPTIYYNNTSQKVVFQTNSADRIVSDVTLAFNTWTHIVLSRVSSVTRLFINGVQQSSTYADTNTYVNGASRPILGHGYANNSAYPNGYYSNVRVLKGTGVTSVTVPNTPLTAITNTQLLICQSNYFVDNSSNAFAVSTSGTPSVQPFSPFAPQYQYTPTITGGSGYFDGTGDFLSSTPTAAMTFNGDFTVEFYIYFATLDTAERVSINCWNTAAGWLFNTQSGAWNWKSNGGFVLSYSTVAPRTGEWTHVAIVRSGSATNNIKMYLNGAIVAQGTSTATMTANTASSTGFVVGGGQGGTGQLINAYMSTVRIVKGVAVYTGAFTPPTAPLSTSGAASAAAYPSTTNVDTTFAASSCSVLLNFTNAGIYDGTLKNNLETVGDAQVSTAVVKYGSGSLKFDGTGDYLTLPNIQTLQLGSSDFTVEAWVYTNASTQQNIICLDGNSTTYAALRFEINGSATRPLQMLVSTNGTSWAINYTAGTIPLGVWTHVAVSRIGSSFLIFINGVQQGVTQTLSGALFAGTLQRVGIDGSGANPFNGYIDDLRVTLGVARYTRNFTPPTVALPRQ